MKKLSKRFAEMRVKCGFTQLQLSELLNVSPTAISSWETGNHLPDIVTLQKAANIFKTSIDYLVGNTDIQEIPLQETIIKYAGKKLRILHAFDKSGLSEETVINLLKDLSKYKL